MATLEKIRKRGKLIAIVIGIALFAFILGDMFQSGKSIFGGSQFKIAEIGGKSVDFQEYQQKLNEAERNYEIRTGAPSKDENSIEQIRRETWSQMIFHYLLDNDLKTLGIGVSQEELADMFQGRNIDPMIMQYFANPETQQFDRARFLQYYNNHETDPRLKAFQLSMEEDLTIKRTYSKYVNLISKGLYVTNKEVEKDYIERTYMVDIEFVAKSYTTIPDSTIKVGNDELKKHYNEFLYEYKQEESRDIAYVTFDVIPSKDDSANAWAWINDSYKYFGEAADAKLYVNGNSDIPYQDVRYKKGDFKIKELDSIMFSAATGTLYGPYKEENYLKIARLIEKVDIPDSAKARHILIQIDGNLIKDKAQAQKLADSLLFVINKGGDFAALAKQYSSDPGSKDKGGEYDWFTEGKMVKEFNDACFLGKKGDIKVIETQFGFHVVEVLDQTKPLTKVTVAILERKIDFSDKTRSAVYAKAARFATESRTAESFEKAIEEQKLVRKVAPNISSSTTRIPGLDNVRELVRWLYSSDKNDVSVVFEFPDKFAVALILEVKEKGIAPFEQVKASVEREVIKRKKAEIIANELNSTNLDELATKIGMPKKDAKNVTFASFSISGIGNEPDVFAHLSTLAKDQVSKPIKGRNGVYVIKITSITPALDTKNLDLSREKSRLMSNLLNKSYKAYETLVKDADVKDLRYKFY